MTATGFLTRVVLRNYKSIANCDVALGPLTYRVGANGSGKSNFVDAQATEHPQEASGLAICYLDVTVVIECGERDCKAAWSRENAEDRRGSCFYAELIVRGKASLASSGSRTSRCRISTTCQQSA